MIILKIKSKISTSILASVIALSIIPISAYAIADNPFIIDKKQDEYEYNEFTAYWWRYYADENNKEEIILKSNLECAAINIVIPDMVNGKKIVGIRESLPAPGFIVNPENKYMECVDNVLFTKDRSKLLSYARFDPRTEYTIPEGTEIVLYQSFYYCDNLEKITVPESLTEFDKSAFFCASNLKTLIIPPNSKLEIIGSNALDETNLEEICLPSFDISIDRSAFCCTPPTLKSYVQPQIIKAENKLSWESISNTSYYEIYQKLSSGKYKLLKTTKSTSCKFPSLKSGKAYTFAIKPVAIIPAANYNEEEDKGYFPESFTIEGTMSEDIVLTGK